ncbi:unnamed protein product [Diamesa serratosioi]
MPVGGRAAGKPGYSNGYLGTGRSYRDINEEIIWASIGMAILIGVLIAVAVGYIIYENCKKKQIYSVKSEKPQNFPTNATQNNPKQLVTIN